MREIVLEQVCKTYGTQKVVDNVSFTAKSGEILGFLGPNGAGKTTTIRMMMGITAPDEGKIRFVKDAVVYPALPKEMVGYLPEERGLYKEARVLNILCFLAGLKKMPKAEAKKQAFMWLEKFDLSAYAHSKIEELSKGMAQKVQFIGSILHQPDYIILDEPFSGLDPVSQNVFKAELKQLAANGAAIVLSGHQMNILEELCDRIYLINKGKEVFYGTLPQIKADYGSFRVKVQCSDSISLQNICSAPSVQSFIIDANNKATLILEEKCLPADFLSSLPKDLAIEEMQMSRSSLHEIFVKIAEGGQHE